MKQKTFQFSSRLTYRSGFTDGFKDRKIKPNATEEYKRGYRDGRNRRDKDL